jgi:hypothetical protein|nr:MAG TPA: Protein of unknown function (DUF1642) [Caudoviricetes sp.]
MNKQELIKKYEEYENGLFDIGARAACQLFLKDLEQLDEPEKAKVPQFVADWIEEAKKSCETVVEFFGYKFSNIEMIKYLKNKERINLVARAWLDGYEVEEEERYTVVTKATKQPLYYNAMDKKLFFSMGGLATNFTRKQLEEAGFGWVFDCEGVEVEEVE